MLQFREPINRENLRLVKIVTNAHIQIQIILRKEDKSTELKIIKEKTFKKPVTHKFLKIEDKAKECKMVTAL